MSSVSSATQTLDGGELMGYGAAAMLASAAIFHADFVGSIPPFVAFLVLGALFFEGGFANLAPYAAEISPVRLAARGVGLAQAVNGIGRIAGPLCLALISGSNNFVTPQATADAVLPAFIFLGASSLLVGATFTAIPAETHGRPLSLGENAVPDLASPLAPTAPRAEVGKRAQA